MLSTASTVPALRSALVPWREAGDTVALVPTMGALHKGHMALVEAARKTAKRVIVSVFVNPLQFGPNEDLAKYPRQPEADQKLLAEAGADLIYMPQHAAMYPEGFTVRIDPGTLASALEGVFRPLHFAGVATVVAKLLLQALPDYAFFGEKDYQQLLIVKRLVRDLDIPVRIRGVPIVRDADNLAFSSRNAYLSIEQRRQAAAFPKILAETVAALAAGKPIDGAVKEGREKLLLAGFKLDYLELRDAGTLAPAHDLTLPARLLAVVRIGSVRLLDNMAVRSG